MEAHKEFLERIWSCFGNRILSAKWEERVVNWWVNPAFIAVYLRGISKSINVIKKERRSWQEEHSRKKTGTFKPKAIYFASNWLHFLCFIIIISRVGVELKVSHTCTALTHNLSEPIVKWIYKWMPGNSELLDTLRKQTKKPCFAMLSKKGGGAYILLIFDGIKERKKQNPWVRCQSSLEHWRWLILPGLTPIEIAVTSQRCILVNFMTLSKRNRWVVGKERFFKNHRDVPLLRPKNQWPTAKG